MTSLKLKRLCWHHVHSSVCLWRSTTPKN